MPSLGSREPISPNAQEAQAFAVIEEMLRSEEPSAKLIGPNREEVAIPPSLYQVMRQAARLMHQGHRVLLLNTEAELTTQEAAAFLNVSRPSLISLLDADAIPFHRVRTHRRIVLADLIAYQRQRQAKRRAFLDETLQALQREGTYR